MPARTASRGERMRAASPFEDDSAGLDGVDAEEGTAEFGSSGADQSGQADDFAGMEREADIAQKTVCD